MKSANPTPPPTMMGRITGLRASLPRPSRGALSSWFIIVLAVAIGLSAAAGVVKFDQAGQDAQQAELIVTRIRVVVEEFEQLNIEYQLHPERALEIGSQFNTYAAEAQSLLDQLAHVAPGAQQEQLEAAFTHLVETIGEARRLALLQPSAVQQYIDEVGTPAGAAFGTILEVAEANYHERAANQRHIARLGMWGVLIAAALCSGTLLAVNEHLRRKATRLLLRQEAHFRALVQHGADLISVVDRYGAIRFQSPSIAPLLGLEPNLVEHQPFESLVHADDRRQLDHILAESKAQPATPVKGELRLLHADGGWRTFEVVANNLLRNPEVAGYVLTSRDVTARNQQAEFIAYQAMHDALTGLPNRRLLHDRLKQGLARANRSGAQCAVIFIDLDDFKVINDSFGHDVGDTVLKLAADRIVKSTRPGDTVARLGGDEFVVLLETAGIDEAFLVADRLGKAMRSPFAIDGRSLTVTVSVGLTTRESAMDEPEDLLRRADVAMYAGKRAGDTAPVIYQETMETDDFDLSKIDTGELLLR